MNGTRTETGERIAVALMALALASGCVPKAAPRQTDVMVKTGSVEVSALVLRAQVNDLADRLAGRLEDAADRIRDGTPDRAIRRRSVVLKVDAIPAVYAAAYRADPLVAALDVWALSFQLGRYLKDGAARDAFGAQQPLARDCARDLLADSDAVVRAFTTGPEAFDRARRRVELWSIEHPIEHAVNSRASIATEMAQDRAQRDAFVSVTAVSDTIENVSERLNTYASQLPKQARWQAELMAADLAETDQLKDTLGDVEALSTAAQRLDTSLAAIDTTLAGVSGLLTEVRVREAVTAERRAVLDEVNSQRLQTLEYASAERRAMLAALHEERVETLKEVDVIKTRAVDASAVALRDLVDYAVWRLGSMLLLLMVAAAVLGIVGYRLTVGRAAAPSP